MLSLKPRSILQLTITGFLLVTGVLVVALIITVNQLNGLSDRSQQVISQSASAMQASGTLTEQASAMERNALQFQVVSDPQILDVYDDRRSRFAGAAELLGTLGLSEPIGTEVTELVDREARAYRDLKAAGQNRTGQASYPGLREDSYRISALVNAWTRQQLDNIRSETGQTRKLLQTQAILLIGLALILAGIFTVLITRPLTQIKEGITQLGSGMYSHRISVTGPRDLIDLGNHLDWLRTRLEKLEKQRSSFLRHVSHELKTPLASMQESASLLNDGVVGVLNEAQQEVLRIQSKNCQRLQQLIDDLLHFNAGSFSVLNAMPEIVRLDKIIDGVVAAHELALKQAKLKIERELGKIRVKANAEQLRVVVDNLFTNAIRFSPEEGRIRLRLVRSFETVTFDIQDQGPGIPESEREKIFDAFYQAASPANMKTKGSGLGLAIAREYTRANGGTLEAMKSDEGARFRLLLPALSGEEE